MTGIDWEDVRLFIEVARCGTLAAAAAGLRLDQTTVSRRLKRFEAGLGGSLFHVEAGRRTLTPLGQRVWQSALDVEASQARLVAAAQDQRTALTGNVRLGVSRIVARYCLAPRLDDFRLNYAGITLDFTVSETLADLRRLEVDMAVRLVDQTAGDLRVKRVGEIAFRAYESCQPSPGRRFAGLSGHMQRIAEIREIEATLDSQTPFFRTNDADLLIAAVQSGAVKAYLPVIVASQNPDLKPVIGVPELRRDVSLVTRADMSGSAALNAVKTWIATCFKTTKPV